MTVASVATAQLARELAAIAGEANVCEEAGALTGFAIDGVRPGIWVVPGSADEVAGIIRVANERRASVTVAGGFTKQSMGNKPETVDILLRTERLNRVLHFDPGDLTVGVEAGCRVGEVQRTASESALLFPLDIAKATQATIGGVLTTASFGPLKHGFGGVREYCIGVSFVTGDGRIAKAGGRVVKNVAGYDLMKLMIGSHGTLGVITSANFKLFPAPKQTLTFVADFADCRSAMEFRDLVRCSSLSPMCLEVLSPRAHDYVAESGEGWSIAVRAAGSNAVLGRYRRELGSSVQREFGGAEEERFWSGVREFPETVVRQHQNAMLLSLQLAATDAALMLDQMNRISENCNFLFACVGRAALASLEYALIPLSVDPPPVEQYSNALKEVLRMSSARGVAIVTHCPREAKRYLSVWGEPTGDLDAMLAVKHALDPNDIMNRGRFLF